jgi:hypothetical protein
MARREVRSDGTATKGTTLREFAAKTETEERLRVQAAQLSRELSSAKHRTSELVAAVYRAASAAMADLNVSPIKGPSIDRRIPDGETAIALVSDWQLGKKTPTYSTEVCERRVMEFAEKTAKITTIQRADHPVRNAKIFLLGDLVEGELIFPGQAHRIDASMFRQVCVDGPRILSNLIRRFLACFDKVEVVCVIGNHGAIGGRSRKEMHPESNSDLMLYTITEMMFKQAGEKRVTFDIPFTEGERSWYAVNAVGQFRFFLAHGDQMRGGGFGGLPHYGFARAINNWASGVIPESFDAAVMGHWHQAASIPFNNRILWINGSTESGNEWLREELKVQCPPSQWLLFCHPKKGITSEHRIWLS